MQRNSFERLEITFFYFTNLGLTNEIFVLKKIPKYVFFSFLLVKKSKLYIN